MKKHFSKFVIAIAVGLVLAKLQSSSITHGIAEKSPHNVVLHRAKQVCLALQYSGVPAGTVSSAKTANEVFATIIAEIDSEKIFHIADSPWHSDGLPDGLWESTSPQGKALGAGENAFSINKRPTNSSPPTPLVVTVSIDEKSKRRLIVSYADGTAEMLGIEDHETYESGSTTVLDRYPDTDWLLPLPPAH